MTFADLEHEYRSELLGSHIYARVRLLTDRLLRRRDPTVYARGAHDYRDALGDVVNDFVLDVLIEERQIDYVMVTATDVDSFDRLVGRQLRRYLARTRARTVVDNLIDRSVRALREPPFVHLGSGDLERFAFGGDPANSEGQPTEGEVRRAAALAQAVPKIAAQGDERAPKVYDGDSLEAVLVILCTSASGPVSRHDLQTFFDHLLTAWTPSFLGSSEEQDRPALTLTPSEEVLVTETASGLASSMTDEERLIFQYKAANLPDRELAAALGLSRQSTAPRKHAFFARLKGELDDLEQHLHGSVLAHLNALLAIGDRGYS